MAPLSGTARGRRSGSPGPWRSPVPPQRHAHCLKDHMNHKVGALCTYIYIHIPYPVIVVGLMVLIPYLDYHRIWYMAPILWLFGP